MSNLAPHVNRANPTVNTFEPSNLPFPSSDHEDLNDLWAKVFAHIEKNSSNHGQPWRNWGKAIKAISFGPESSDSADSGLPWKAKLGTPTVFAGEYLRQYYLKIIQSAFELISGKRVSVEISVLEGSFDTSALDNGSSQHSVPTEQLVEQRNSISAFHDSEPTFNPSSNVGPSTASGPRFESEHVLRPLLDNRYSFESFIVGPSNQFAHASAYAVAENCTKKNSLKIYNPLFLFSPPGLGKTHLLHAIGNHITAHNPDIRVLYISAEHFVNELIESIMAPSNSVSSKDKETQRMPQFRSKYRDYYDVILFDDIQFIGGKNRSQEEFFHTFNALHSSRRQIVMTCDRPPREIKDLEERLRTRIEWGLIADIAPPDIETRIAILKNKAERDDIYLPDEVATFVASYIKSNVRELEGVLIKLQAHASLTGVELSLDLAKQQLKQFVPQEGHQFTAESIQDEVAKHFQIKVSELKNNSKQRMVARPRQIAMFLIRKYTSMGFKEIGSLFGGRDHSTIMHACKEVERLIENDSQVKLAVEAIQAAL